MFRRPGRGRVLLLVFLALSILVITLDYRQNEGGPLERAKDISLAIVAPIQRGITAVVRPIGEFFSSLGELSSLRSENERLEDELAQLQSEEEQLQELAEENQRLTDLLDLERRYATLEPLTAEVIGRVPSNYQWAVLIDKGRSDGIRPDMAVINLDGLVGKIVQADSHIATVLLLIDPRGAAGARIERGRDTGFVTGNGVGEDLSLELIDPGSDVNRYDQVETSGYNGGIFPPGIPIGVVIAVAGEGPAVQQDIDVEPHVNFTSLDFVQILLESGPRLDPAEGDQ
jgi:rod shape-determining protein MreC